MKLTIVFVAVCIAFAAALPQAPVETVRFVDEKSDDGYNFAYETSDGQKREETGTLKDAPPTPENPNNKVINVIGSYEFIAPDGGKYIVTYTADERGFLPKVTRA